jgi:hypothetical protein
MFERIALDKSFTEITAILNQDLSSNIVARLNLTGRYPYLYF